MPGSQPELRGRPGEERPEDRGRRRSRRDPVERQPGPRRHDDRSGWTWPGSVVSAATPVRRSPTHSQLARYQRAAASAARPWRSAHSAWGRMPRTQPASPVASASSASSAARARVEPGDRRTHGRPSAAGGDQRRALPVDPDRGDLDRRRRREQLGGHRPDRRPPVRGILLDRPAGRVGVERVGGPGEPEELPVETDQPGLRLGRPEIDREDGPAGHPGSVASRASAARAWGIVRQATGMSGRHARKPAPSQPATARSRSPHDRP